MNPGRSLHGGCCGLLVALLALVTTGAQAREWELGVLLKAGADQHPLVAGRRADRAVAQADRETAGWQRYPTVSAELSTRDVAGAGRALRLDQPLWAGGRIEAGIAAADGRLSAAQAAVEEAQLDLKLRVAAAASEALRQQDRLTVADAQVREMDQLVDMIRRRVEQEVSAVADLNLARARRLSSVNERTTVQQALAAALVQLTQLAGDTVTRVATPGAPWVAADRLGGLNELQDRALAHAPQLRRLRFEAEAAEATVRVRRAALSPQVVLRLESVHARVGGTDNRALVVLQAQPGAGLSAMSAIGAAEAAVQSSREAHEAARRDVTERVQLAWTEWQASRERFEVAQQIRTSSADVAASYARQYATGRKNWVDVLNAVREAGQADMASVDASHQARAAVLRLLLLMGMPE